MHAEKLETVQQLLDALIVVRKWGSDYRIAKELNVHQTAVSGWRTGKAFPNDERCLAIAEALRLEPIAVLAIVHAARNSGTAAEKYWRALRERSASERVQEIGRQIAQAAKLAALAAAAQLPLFSSPANVAPAELTAEQCILSKIKRIRRKAA